MDKSKDYNSQSLPVRSEQRSWYPNPRLRIKKREELRRISQPKKKI